MVSIKYVLIVLRADDEGEGGTFAIYSLLSRYVRRAFRDVGCADKYECRPTLSDVIREKS